MKDMPIYNWIPLSMAVAFVWAAVFFKMPEGALGNVLLAVGVLLVGFVPAATGLIGAGAVKCFAAASLWMGPHQAFLTFAAVTVIGSAVLAMVGMRMRGGRTSVPVLPAMILAFGLALPQAPIWQAVMAGLHPGT